MSTKAIKKQLVAAVAMVMVAAIALGSSTFAWFAQNNTVTASGISMTAQSEGKLLMIDTKSSSAGGFADKLITTTAMAKEQENATKVVPSHPEVGASGAVTWYHNTSDSFNISISGTTAEVAVVNGSTAADTYYYLSDTLYVKLDGTNDNNLTAKDLKVSKCEITVDDTNSGTDAAKSLLACARVLVVVKDAEGAYKSAVFTNNAVVPAERAADAGSSVTTTTAALTSASNPVVATKINTTTDVVINVYIYFEGRDEHCVSAQFDTEQFNVALAFTADLT